MATPLINIQDVRDLLDLSSNVTEQKYNQHILSAQNWQLKELIGSTCLQELEDRKCSNSLTDADKTLLQYVKPYLIYYSYSKYVYNSMMQDTNDGIVKFSGDNIIQLSETEKKHIKQYNESNAEAYTKDIIKVLEDNPDDYTCYECGDCCNKEIKGRSIFNI